jgi:hypothetical protein
MIITNIIVKWDSLVGALGVDSHGSIPGKGKNFSSTPQRPNPAPSLIANEYQKLSPQG